jgi:hypothetical protein
MDTPIDIDKSVTTPKTHPKTAKPRANGDNGANGYAIEAPNPPNLAISLEDLRLDDQDYENSAGIPVITTVRVGKPDRQVFVRVNPDPAWRLQTALLELKEDREVFAIAPELRAELSTETMRVELYSTITRDGVFSLWPVKIPGTDGRSNPWHESAVAAAQVAMTKWVKVRADMSAKSYVVVRAVDTIPEPEWPTSKTFLELVNLAFAGRYITDRDHPVLRRLRGQV